MATSSTSRDLRDQVAALAATFDRRGRPKRAAPLPGVVAMRPAATAHPSAPPGATPAAAAPVAVRAAAAAAAPAVAAPAVPTQEEDGNQVQEQEEEEEEQHQVQEEKKEAEEQDQEQQDVEPQDEEEQDQEQEEEEEQDQEHQDVEQEGEYDNQDQEEQEEHEALEQQEAVTEEAGTAHPELAPPKGPPSVDFAKSTFFAVLAKLRGEGKGPLSQKALQDAAHWRRGGQNEEAPCEPVEVRWLWAAEALAAAVHAGLLPAPQLAQLSQALKVASAEPAKSRAEDRWIGALRQALEQPKCWGCWLARSSRCTCIEGMVPCNRCTGTGRFRDRCRRCGDDARRRKTCDACLGRGSTDVGECRRCAAKKTLPCTACLHKVRLCPECNISRVEREANRRAAAAARAMSAAAQGPPAPGVRISLCGAGELSAVRELWTERGGAGEVLAAWSVDNPLLAYRFHERRTELRQLLGREADDLQGFHGTLPGNVLSISEHGFDKSRRAGQVYGSGEYFAKNPEVSRSYCQGGGLMFICRLSLGEMSMLRSNCDGDHLWVPECQYYVISEPAQVLPRFIIRFAAAPRLSDPVLEAALAAKVWSTMKQVEQIVPVPQNRRCFMSHPFTDALWLGYLHAHLTDEQLERDVRAFFEEHAPQHTKGLRVHIARGKFKKAHIQADLPLPRELVHQLNKLPFLEGGVKRFVCVEDGHGSPQQNCPRWIATYCRGQNLRYTHPCWCAHPSEPTAHATFQKTSLDLDSAKADEIRSKFLSSGTFHDGRPSIVAIHRISNPVLERLHEEYRKYLWQKNREEPPVRELYHGTNNKIHDIVFQRGLRPPSDYQASDSCPVSGGKGLSTSLCTNSCTHCTERHHWDRCHMYGLGIYLADLAQKSHRYVQQPEQVSRGRRRCRMIICSVLGRALEIRGHLRAGDAMHDVPNVRSLSEDLPSMVVTLRDKKGGAELTAEQCDLLFIKGLGDQCRPGYSVFNSEFIAFHPHQCLPKYEITYDVYDH